MCLEIIVAGTVCETVNSRQMMMQADTKMTLSSLAHRQSGLLYEDLLGVPCILILCEKGRMGDTFPHTFDCLDMRLR